MRMKLFISLCILIQTNAFRVPLPYGTGIPSRSASWSQVMAQDGFFHRILSWFPNEDSGSSEGIDFTLTFSPHKFRLQNHFSWSHWWRVPWSVIPWNAGNWSSNYDRWRGITKGNQTESWYPVGTTHSLFSGVIWGGHQNDQNVIRYLFRKEK